MAVCDYATVKHLVVSTDHTVYPMREYADGRTKRWLVRPPELAQDDTPMIAVVQHALAEIPGPPEQIIVLLQPTQPLRKPEHITRAVSMLQSLEFDSVVSIVAIPRTHAPDFVLMYDHVCLIASSWLDKPLDQPTRRQSVPRPYIRDGTVYAFYRRTVERFGNLYGEHVGALEIDSNDTCPLDTELDWAEAERRLRA